MEILTLMEFPSKIDLFSKIQKKRFFGQKSRNFWPKNKNKKAGEIFRRPLLFNLAQKKNFLNQKTL